MGFGNTLKRIGNAADANMRRPDKAPYIGDVAAPSDNPLVRAMDTYRGWDNGIVSPEPGDSFFDRLFGR